MPEERFIQVGQVWRSPDSGNQWKVTGFRLPSWKGQPTKVYVLRLNAPKWDDGKYVFVSCQFRTMELISNA